MRSLPVRLLTGAVGVVLLAGCTTNVTGTAAPDSGATSDTRPETTTESSSNSDDLPTDGAPKVEDPIDTTKFQDDPCLSLTSDQSEGIFGVGAAGKVSNDPLGKTCSWSNDSSGSKVWVGFFDKDPRGLSAEYGAEDDGRWAYFEELPAIEGQPAVARSQVDDRDSGICTVVVGASDEIAFDARVRLSDSNVGKKNPCEVAVDIAGEAVKTMKAG